MQIRKRFRFFAMQIAAFLLSLSDLSICCSSKERIFGTGHEEPFMTFSALDLSPIFEGTLH